MALALVLDTERCSLFNAQRQRVKIAVLLVVVMSDVDSFLFTQDKEVQIKRFLSLSHSMLNVKMRKCGKHTH
jgi:hypothetical protein